MRNAVPAIEGQQKKVNIPNNIKELLGKNCEVGKLMKFLKDIRFFEDIQIFNGEEMAKREV